MLAMSLALITAAVPADVVKEAEVRAVPGELWKAWTTVEGVKTFFAPDARIELKPGGAYAIWFDPSQPEGQRGADDCQVVAVEPLKRLSFSWNFPPSIPELRGAKAHTTVTVELLPQGKTTKVRLTQTGWREGAEWEKGRAYFDRAWGVVLARLQHRFRRGPLDWKQPWVPATVEQLRMLEGTWRDAEGTKQESWAFTEAGGVGTWRRLVNGKPGRYELFALEPDDGEWVLTMRGFGVGMQPEGDASRLVLDVVEPGRLLFVTEGGPAMRVEYVRKGEQLDILVKLPERELHHVMSRAR